MTELGDGRAELTRRQILRAGAHQFAHRSYHEVSLDDILACAQVSKGALYAHFRSKHGLALALIDAHSENTYAAARSALARRLSALETVIDVSYFIAAQDLASELARSALNLVESIGRADDVQVKWISQWIDGLAMLIQRAVAEGDLYDDVKPDSCGRMLVAMQMGLRQTSDLSNPEGFLADLEDLWIIALRGLMAPDRIVYLKRFLKRRTAVVTKGSPPQPGTP